jgi:hypothetical protein
MSLFSCRINSSAPSTRWKHGCNCENALFGKNFRQFDRLAVAAGNRPAATGMADLP